MNTERLPQAAEQLPAHLQFMSTDAINDFRAQQHDNLIATRKDHITAAAEENVFDGSLARAFDAGHSAAKSNSLQDCEDYIAQNIDRESNPELFNDLLIALVTSTIYAQNSTEWFRGQKDDEGKFIPGSAGKDKLAQHMQMLAKQYGEQPTDGARKPDGAGSTPHSGPQLDPNYKVDLTRPAKPYVVNLTRQQPKSKPNLAPTDPELAKQVADLEGRVESLRSLAAELSINRRRRLSNKGKKRGDLQKQFEDASEEYNRARIELGALHVKQLQAQGVDQNDINKLIFVDVINELGRFTSAEKRVLETDNSFRGKFGRFLARSNKHMFAGSVVAGAGIGIIAREAKGKLASSAAIAVLGGAAAGALVAVGAVRGSLGTVVKTRGKLITEHQKRAEYDTNVLHNKGNELQSEFTETTTDLDARKEANYLLQQVITTRITRDQKTNRHEVYKGAAAGAAGGLLGAVGASAVHSLIDNGMLRINLPGTLFDIGVGDGKTGNLGTYQFENPGGSDGHGPRHHGGHGPKNHDHIPGKNGKVDGFDTTITVENGNGYTNELQDLAAQKDINLSGAESYELYQHLEGKFGGNLFTNVDSYAMGDDYGISHPGAARWNPAAIHEMQRWLEENDKLKKAA